MTIELERGLDPTTLRSNGQVLIASLRPVLARFEAAYGFPSSELDERVAAGQVDDTLEICEWFIAWRSYSAAVDGRPPRRRACNRNPA